MKGIAVVMVVVHASSFARMRSMRCCRGDYGQVMLKNKDSSNKEK